jgi:predicted transcriptional regulator
MAMARSKSLDEKRKEAVRKLVIELVRDRFGGNQTHAAKALGVSQPFVRELLQGTKGGSLAIVEGLANLNHVLVDRILARESTDLEVALDFFRDAFSEKAIRAARAEAERGVKHDPRGWALFLRERQAEEDAATDTDILGAQVEKERESAAPEPKSAVSRKEPPRAPADTGSLLTVRRAPVKRAKHG